MFDPVEKLKEFIRHASISTDSKAAAGMKGAQEFVSGLLGSLGFKVEVVKTEKHPIIFAQRGGDKSWPHVVIYGHYDVQPADPLNLWKTPPFEPTIIGNRIYGRGAADNKGPLLTNIAAVAPASAAASSPSANGNNASLATTEPCKSSFASPAFQTAMRELSTRAIWPAPMPSVCSPRQ